MLILTRNEGTAIYGGESLTDDLEGTFEHKIEIAELDCKDRRGYAIINVIGSDGSIKTVRLDSFNDCYNINKDVGVFLLAIRTMRTDSGGVYYQARLGFIAPRRYRVVRDDAVKKVA
jgi:sRNA-binding carbon storage regulator CsrA